MSKMNRQYPALELDKVLELLAQHTSCEDARLAALNLEPQTDLASAQALMNQTRDAHMLLARFGGPAFGGLINVNNALYRADAGSTLSLKELLNVASVLHVIRTISQWRSTNEGVATVLDVYFNALMPNRFLEDSITTAIISEEEIADNASPTLADIRRKIRAQESKVRDQLGKYTHNSNFSKYLQDNIITMRNGRYVIPVRNEYRGEVPGLVHDTSSSGATVFIEPMPIVEANNQIKLLKNKEEDEIDRILAELSANVGSFADSIKNSYECAVELNLIFAKAQLAYAMRASVPQLNNEGIIELRRARHPLIDKNKVVPVDISLGTDFDTIVITGPNTGGKTVSIKTIGLMSLMAMCGLMLPVDDRSRISVFDHVLADIGDEQSIEQSLSTFSSHMTNIIRILNEASLNSLVLFDELCAGTDPTEGAALAIAILSHLHKMGIRTMATTHYSELKVFALSADGVENACCEFDVETLSPTYRLLIGIPGKSNAFAISRKLGLPDFLIEDARGHLSEQNESFEDLLSDLESSRRTIEMEQAEIQEHKEEIRSLREALEKKQEKLEAQRDRILREANEQARQVLQEAKDYADETMKNFHKFGKANISASEMEAERAKLRERMKKTEKAMAKDVAKKPKKVLKASDLHLGDTVKVLSLNLQGTVNTLPDARGNLYVQMGILRSQVKLTDLELVEEAVITAKQFQRTSAGKIKMSKSASVSTEINLIGMTVDEALAHLDKYLDDAYLAHLPSVRIVHGKGTGALRKAVQGLLKRNKYVKSYRLGEFGEGDAGVTIATFKQE